MSSSSARRTRMSAADRRDQLLDVTTQLVAEEGFLKVSIEAVARRAGITRPIVYEHFGDLQGLLEAVVDREMGRAHAQVSATAMASLSAGRPRDVMVESLAAFLGAVEAHPTTWRLVLMAPEGAPESLRRSIAQGRAEVLAHLVDAVRPLTDREASDAELTARVLSAISDEYARMVLEDPARFPPERLLAHASWMLEQVGL